MSYNIYCNGEIGYDTIPTKEAAYRRAEWMRSFYKSNHIDVKVSVRKKRESSYQKEETIMQSEAIKQFIESYFQAEKRAETVGHPPTTLKFFLIKDRFQIVEDLKNLINNSEIHRTYNMATLLTTYEYPNLIGKERHSVVTKHVSRLKKWTKEYESGVLKIENAIAGKREVPRHQDITKLKYNFIESVKAVCHSGFKNGFSEEDIKSVLNDGFVLVKEERKIQEVKGSLQAFLRDKGITKDLVLQILELA